MHVVACGGTYHGRAANPTQERRLPRGCLRGRLRAGSFVMTINQETVKQRLEVYHDQTQPLIDYYNKEGILKEVDGTVDLQDVFDAIV